MKTIRWSLYLRSSPDVVFNMLTTKKGMERFWAEKVEVTGDLIHFNFPNGQEYKGRIIRIEPPGEFSVDYFNSKVEFILQPAESGGTVLSLVNSEVPDEEFTEVHAGWVSVLLNLKAVVDFGVDLRNHDEKRTWDQGFVEN